MEKVWYYVLFLTSINQVFAIYRDCNNLITIESCNECIRCNGYWCNDPNEDIRCVGELRDNWCNKDQEPVHYVKESLAKGKYFNFNSRVKSIYRSADRFEITYPYRSDAPKVDVLLVNSTQNPIVTIDYSNTECSAANICTTTLESEPDTNFCNLDGGVYEYYNMKLTVDGINEEVDLKYHVPCACECSKVVEHRSERCGGHGSYSCGTCTCEEGWSGKFCKESKCKRGRYVAGKCVCDENWSGERCDRCDARGDVGEECGPREPGKPECSGHGVCDCGCLCYNDTSLYGSRYFDRNNNCQDLCMHISSTCDQCTFSSEPGKCEGCEFPLHRLAYNASVMDDRDDQNRHIWVRCNDTSINNCSIDYAAMRHAGVTYLMVIGSCDSTSDAIVGQVNMTIPIVLGLLALLTILAVGGFLFWKNRMPPLPLNDPAYENVGAEDCVGENPLYKPPTSSFKNPTYGKW